jgi:hypothetical protein
VGFVPEFWGGFGLDYDEDGNVTERERLRWNEMELNGEGFADWSPYDHPQLGPVEIGGWRARFTRRNPPPDLLQTEIERYVPWMMWLAEVSPRVVIGETTVAQLAEDVFRVTAVVENEGYLPTHLTQRALDARIAVPLRAMVGLEDAELIVGEARTDLGHLSGTRNGGSAGTAEARRVLDYVVRATGRRPVLRLTVRSEKAGIAREDIALPGR